MNSTAQSSKTDSYQSSNPEKPPTDRMEQTQQSKMETKDLKQLFMGTGQTRIFANGPMPDLKKLAVMILAKAIPNMEEHGDVAFAWLWARNDLGVYNQKEYETETSMYAKQHKMKKCDGDTVYHYDFTKDGKKRRCILTTEIWYKPRANHQLSPVAMLFGQYMSNGLHITKCRFENVE